MNLLETVYHNSYGGCFVECGCDDSELSPSYLFQKKNKWWGIYANEDVLTYNNLKKYRETNLCKVYDHENLNKLVVESNLDTTIHYLKWNYKIDTLDPLNCFINQEIDSLYSVRSRAWHRKIIVCDVILTNFSLENQFKQKLENNFNLVFFEKKDNTLSFINNIYKALLP